MLETVTGAAQSCATENRLFSFGVSASGLTHVIHQVRVSSPGLLGACFRRALVFSTEMRMTAFFWRWFVPRLFAGAAVFAHDHPPYPPCSSNVSAADYWCRPDSLR